MKKIILIVLAIFIIIISWFYFIQEEDSCSPPKKYEVKVDSIFNRSPKSFTQGFFIHKGKFYESFGGHGQSGRKVYQKNSLLNESYQGNSPDVFAEGMAYLKGDIVQLTWHAEKAFRLNEKLKVLSTFTYQGEGWGLTSNKEHYIMSNGSSELVFRDHKSFQKIKKILVKNHKEEIKNLNELEFIKGEVWANLWLSDNIVTINPRTGCVQKEIDAHRLWDYEDTKLKRKGGVLNGIAYDKKLGHIYLTGKYWRHIFQVSLKLKK